MMQLEHPPEAVQWDELDGTNAAEAKGSSAWMDRAAHMLGIRLQAAHYFLIEEVQAFFEKYDDFPTNRWLVHQLNWKFEAGWDSLKLQSLFQPAVFNGSFLRQLAFLAGLPRPSRCV